MNEEALLEIVGEGFDYLMHLVRDAQERMNRWEASYRVASFTESYLVKSACIRVHLFVGNGNLADLCIRFERHPAMEDDTPDILIKGSERNSANPAGDDEDQLVFVGVVHLMKKPKGASPVAIPSLIRLKLPDSCPMLRVEKLHALAPAANEMGGLSATALPPASLDSPYDEDRKLRASRVGMLQ